MIKQMLCGLIFSVVLVQQALCAAPQSIEPQNKFRVHHLVSKPVASVLRTAKRATKALGDSMIKSAAIVGGTYLITSPLRMKSTPADLELLRGMFLSAWVMSTCYASWQKTHRWLVGKDKVAVA